MEKTADRVTIKNQGRVLYNQAFAKKDKNCLEATTIVKTQVWKYDGSLGLSVYDNSNAVQDNSDSVRPGKTKYLDHHLLLKVNYKCFKFVGLGQF